MLLGHILDNKDELSTAYRQLDPLNRSPRWGMVSISLTSPIMKSILKTL
jgi:hypothetical protein